MEQQQHQCDQDNMRMIFLERCTCPSPPDITENDDEDASLSTTTTETYPITVSTSFSPSCSSWMPSSQWQSIASVTTTSTATFIPTGLYRPLALRPMELASCLIQDDEDDFRLGVETKDRGRLVTERPSNPSPCHMDDDEEEEEDCHDVNGGNHRLASRFILHEIMQQQQQQQHRSRTMSSSPVTEDEDDEPTCNNNSYSPNKATPRTIAIVEDDDSDVVVVNNQCTDGPMISSTTHVILTDDAVYDDGVYHCRKLESARNGLLSAVSLSNMDPKDNPQFLQHLQVLHTNFLKTTTAQKQKSTSSSPSLLGKWLALSKSIFRECLGTNDAGDPLYTLSRMSFDLFEPSNLVCSLQGTFNTVRDIPSSSSAQRAIPPALQGYDHLQTYDCLAAFTMEAGTSFGDPRDPDVANNKSLVVPVKGIFQTSGFVAPDPHVPNRHLVWYVSATMRANDTPRDKYHWQKLFANNNNAAGLSSWMRTPMIKSVRGTRHVQETSQSFVFASPMASYIDTLYQDDTLRVGRGNHGSYYVLTKLSNP